MNTAIKERIKALGGTYRSGGSSLESDLNNILFPKTFLIKGFEDFLQEETYKKLADGEVVLDAEIPYPRMTVQSRLFTPFKIGTEDNQEFGDIDEELVREIIDAETLDFMIIGETESYPNFYFVCLSDTEKENPLVYSTDHESYFDEITVEGTLEEFLFRLVSAAEYQESIDKLAISLQARK